MIVNKYRFSDNGTERKIQIPIEITWDMEGRGDAIDVYENEVVEQVINPPEDFEVTRFDHQLSILLSKKLKSQPTLIAVVLL